MSRDKPGKWHIVGPTADDDIRRAIALYGYDAVKAAMDRHKPKVKRGPKKKIKWSELRRFCIDDHAREWLEGGDPFSAHTNYSIKKAYAEAYPDHSVETETQEKNVDRTLKAKPFGRKFYTLVCAKFQSQDAYPHAAHIRALEALCELDVHEVWELELELAKRAVADYTRKHGAPPDDELNMKQVKEGARNDGLSGSHSAGNENARPTSPPRSLDDLLTYNAKDPESRT